MSTPDKPEAGWRFRDAVARAIAAEMRSDPRVVLLGEDVAKAGGVFKATEGLLEEFGPGRVFDTPISEIAIMGAALGAAVTGIRPIAELMFTDFAAVALDQIVNEIAKFRFMSGGQTEVPLVIRTACGGGIGFGAQHSQTFETYFMQAPGLKLFCPSTPADAYWLLREAIKDPNPVVFLEHKALYGVKGAWDVDLEPLPAGKVRVCRTGSAATIVASMMMVHRAMEAANVLAQEGLDVEVIDVRTLVPLDRDALVASVAKTGRLVIVEEGPARAGWGADIGSLIAERAPQSLKAPIERVNMGDMPLPYSPTLEAEAIPNAARIAGAVRRTLSR